MTDTRIMLASGVLFDLTNPAGSPMSLQDIAHGLGRVCRFAGQTNRFYSVAEHCFHVARLVPVELARVALLHDASEAFIGDVTRPLKALLPDYQAIEARELMPNVPGYWSSLPVDPAALDKARATRLNFDRPEFATAAWLRAWHRYGHWQEDLQAKGELA